MLLQEKSKFSSLLKNMSPTRIVVFSFLIVILIGGILLTLPISNKGERISLIDSFFIATSATCVTGLTVCDPYTTFTYFGQAVLLCLIQVGGLGLATLATAFTLLFRKKIGLRNLLVFGESSGSDNLNLVDLLKMIMSVTFITETVGALLLMIRFVPMCGPRGIWTSVFLSISAFCNAGFDVLGFVPGNSSLTAFSSDPLVCMTIAALIVIGGLGFVVVQEVWVSKVKARFLRRKVHRLSFHSKVCVTLSLSLILIGTVLFFLFEYNNTLGDMSLFDKVITSIFQSVNTRTAGFASVPIDQEHDITKIMTVMLMFIGGAPGSTAGGIKITTMIVMFAAVFSTFLDREDAVFMGHRFSKKIVYKSFCVTICAIILVLVDICLLVFLNDPGYIIDVLFEAVSAFGTVGLTAGVTPNLNFAGKLIIMLTMFIGRVGPVSFGIAIATKGSRKAEPILPEGRMLIG